MLTTYFYGCWWLPVMLTMLDFDVVKLGKQAPITSANDLLVAGGSGPVDKVVEDEEFVEDDEEVVEA
jgi:hypothetical protein